MILQVNKKKKKDKDFLKNGSHDVFRDFDETLYSYDRKQKIIPSSEYERKSGKSTTLIELSKRYSVPYISNLDNKARINRSIEQADLKGRTIIVDEVDAETITYLNDNGISAVGIIQNNQKNLMLSTSSKSKAHKIYEDYIDVSNVQQKDNMITAEARIGQMNLYRDKKFEDKRDNYYNYNNIDYIIESVYLLDDTGKTIKKLM